MHTSTSQHSVSHINHVRQLSQQLIQQTQQANQLYQQMLHSEQQNVQMLEQMLQKERMAIQGIQQGIQGHELAIQRCQQVINECTQMERELSGQAGTFGHQQQTFGNPAFQTQQFQQSQNPSFHQ